MSEQLIDEIFKLHLNSFRLKGCHTGDFLVLILVKQVASEVSCINFRTTPAKSKHCIFLKLSVNFFESFKSYVEKQSLLR